MPSPDQAAKYGDRLIELIARTELALLRRLAEQLGRGLDAPDWQANKLAELRLWRARLERDMSGTHSQAVDELVHAMDKAYGVGGAKAFAVLPDTADTIPPARTRQLITLLQDGETSLGDVTRRALRSTTDIYQRVVAEAVPDVLLGAQTRRQAAQAALNRFTENGITGFVDKAGRSWNMSTYTEMATRTAVGRAHMTGYMEHLSSNGEDLVIVSSNGRSCPLCEPWEGKVLSIGGGVAGRISRLSAINDDSMVSVHVEGSVTDAYAAGFGHPNCRHSLDLYQPDLTEVPDMPGLPDTYEDEQHQRYLERGLRHWKRREEVGLDEAARRAARVKQREWSARIKDHTDRHKTLRRKRHRESLAAR